MQDILIVGPGAVGGLLAARWARAGRRVRLLDRTRGAETRLVSRGLRVTDRSGKVRAIRQGLLSARAQGGAPVSAAFFCVKSQDTAAAIKAAARWVGPETAVVGLQNGLGHERRLRQAFGPRRTVIGTCYFAADRPAPFTFAHNGGEDVLLAANDANGAAATLAQRLLKQGRWKVGVKRSEDRMLWTKLCFNAAVNGLGALCATPNGRLAEDPALRELVRAVIAEAVLIAKKAGHPPLYRHMADLVLRGCRNAPRQRNSTLQDLQAGRPTETPAIFGPLLSAARRTGAPAPLLTVIASTLKRLERSTPR